MRTQSVTTRAPLCLAPLGCLLLAALAAFAMQALSVKELRALLDGRGVSYADCVEKVKAQISISFRVVLCGLLSDRVQADLIRRVEETSNLPPRPAIVPVYTRPATIADLQCHVVGNSEAPGLVVVIAHGYGANYNDFVDMGVQILRTLSSDQIPAAFIFPNGFLPLPGGGATQRSWWPIDFQALFGEVLSGRLHLHIPPGLAEARKRMVALVDALKAQYRLPMQKIVIGGFSQGAMLTTDVSLHLTEAPAALLLLSGTLVAEPVWRPLLAQRKGLRVLQQHGTNDQVRHTS